MMLTNVKFYCSDCGWHVVMASDCLTIPSVPKCRACGSLGMRSAPWRIVDQVDVVGRVRGTIETYRQLLRL